MSKYDVLWSWIKENGTDSFKLTFAEIENITGFSIDQSFLTYKKELKLHNFCMSVNVPIARESVLMGPRSLAFSGSLKRKAKR